MYSRNKCSLCKVIIFFVVKATSATLTDGCGILGKSSQSLPIKKKLRWIKQTLDQSVNLQRHYASLALHQLNKASSQEEDYVSRRKIKFKLLWVGMVSRRLWTIWASSKSP